MTESADRVAFPKIPNVPRSLLEKLPSPLVRDILENRCLPIVGAGFSRNAVLPAGLAMPLWSEMGDALARQCGFPNTDAIDAVSEFNRRFGAVGLASELRRMLHVGVATPGEAHRAFCELPFDVVCTTNWDSLVEDGYRIAGRRFRRVTREGDLSLGGNADTTLLLKFHGDLDDVGSLVATETDYDGFGQERPLMATYLSSLLIVRTPLFLGYSADDPDFRQLWQVIGNRLGRLRRTAYALVGGSNANSRARFQRRGVDVIEL
jgi:hypothetical protein